MKKEYNETMLMANGMKYISFSRYLEEQNILLEPVLVAGEDYTKELVEKYKFLLNYERDNNTQRKDRKSIKIRKLEHVWRHIQNAK